MELKFIGRIQSQYKTQDGTPIQPSFAEESIGEIVLERDYVDALADLIGFDRIWVIYAFHKATPFKHRIVPYRDTVERGLFATRAPCRPNPIGMSVVKLEGIEENVLRISGVDMLDGTPVLDIKPYVPDFDSYPNSKAGWLDLKRASRQRADQRFEK